MQLVFETTMLGIAVRVYSDRVEYKNFIGPLESIPINQIASIKLGGSLVNRIVIETTCGHRYAIATAKKQELANAIYQAQAAFRTRIASPTTAGVADELSKLARLRDQGMLSPTEFEQQKALWLGGAGASTAAYHGTQSRRLPRPLAARRSSLGRTIKFVLLGIVAFFALMVVIGLAVGPKRKESTDTGNAASSSTTFQDFRVELTNYPKEKPVARRSGR
jgi:hypothetical protein